MPVSSLAVTDNSWTFSNGKYHYYIRAVWTPPTTGPVYETFEVYMDSGDGKGFVFYDYTTGGTYDFPVENENLGNIHTVRVLTVNSFGKKNISALTDVATPVVKSTPPSDVPYLNLSTTSTDVILDWGAIADVDTYNYEIRYSPILDATWNTSTHLISVGHVVGQSTYTATVPGRDGTYLIKAKDYIGNVSTNPALALTTIPGSFEGNVVATREAGEFLGEKTNVVINEAGELVLDRYLDGEGKLAYYSEGYYTFPEDILLGTSYFFNISSYLNVEGEDVSPYMDYWPVLALVNPIGFLGDPSTGWNVEAQYRSYNYVGGVITPGPWTSFTTATDSGSTIQIRL